MQDGVLRSPWGFTLWRYSQREVVRADADMLVRIYSFDQSSQYNFRFQLNRRHLDHLSARANSLHTINTAK